jgi:hypothetical protein
VQLRVWFDGVSGFAGLVPLSIALTLGALALVVWRPGVRWAVLAGAMYSVALLTYEPVILFAPVLAIIIWWVRRRWQPVAPVLGPALVLGVTFLVARARLAAPPSTSYTLVVDPARSWPAFLKQIRRPCRARSGCSATSPCRRSGGRPSRWRSWSRACRPR